MTFDFSQHLERDLERIETVLTDHAAVKEAIAIIHDNPFETKTLTVYLVPSQAFLPSTLNRRISQLMYLEKHGNNYPLQYCLLPEGYILKYEYLPEVEFLYAEIFFPETYLRHGIEFIDHDCIFDVGANIGLFSLLVYSKHRNVHLYAFEPAPSTFETLNINVNLHQMNMQPFAYGLSNKVEDALLVFFPQATVMSNFSWLRNASSLDNPQYFVKQHIEQNIHTEGKDAWQKTFFNNEIHKCKIETLSNIIKKECIECINLLKIDAENSELDILLGIEDDDWGKIEQIVLEVHNRYFLDQIILLLKKHHYDIIVEVPESYTLVEDDPHKVALYLVFAIGSSKSVIGVNDVKYVPFVKSPLLSSQSERLSDTNISNNYIAPDDLRSFLYNRLPNIATVPTEFVLIKSLPLDSKGDIDRRSLSLIDTTIFDFSENESK